MPDKDVEEESKKREERDKIVAKYVGYVIGFLLLLLAASFYRSCSVKKSSNSVNKNYEVPAELEEIKDDFDLKDDKKDYAVVTKSLNFTKDTKEKSSYKEVERSYSKKYITYDNNYLEEYLSDGDIDSINANDVTRLQNFLNKHGYRVRVDGIFRRQTKEALKAFQRSYGIRADGIVGYKTRRLINRLVSQGR